MKKTLIVIVSLSLLSFAVPAEAKVCGIYHTYHTSNVTGKTKMRTVYRCS